MGFKAIIQVGPVMAKLLASPREIAVAQRELTRDIPGAEHTPAYKYRGWDGTACLLNKDCTFLSGLTWRVAGALVKAGFDKPIIEWPAAVRGEPLAESQVGITFRAYQDRTVERALLVRRLLVKSPPGTGKTEIGIEISRRLGLPVLWITHRKVLLEQTAARFRERLPDVDIQTWGAGKKKIGTVTIATWQSLGQLVYNERTEKQDWTVFNEEFFAPFRVVIADEGHRAGADQPQAVMAQCRNAQYRIALSATPETPNPVTNLKIEGAFGPTWTVEQISVLVKQGFLAKPHVVCLSVGTAGYPSYQEVRTAVCPSWRKDPKQLVKLGAQMFRWAYDTGIVGHKTRNLQIVVTANKHAMDGEKVLVLCNRVPHALALAETIRQRLPKCPVWQLDGGSGDRDTVIENFKAHQGGAVLVATPFFREGVDVPEIDAGIMACAGMSDIATLQALGRMLRKRPDKDEVLVYDFVDGRDLLEDKDYLAQHWLSRLALYQKEKFSIEERRA